MKYLFIMTFVFLCSTSFSLSQTEYMSDYLKKMFNERHKYAQSLEDVKDAVDDWNRLRKDIYFESYNLRQGKDLKSYLLLEKGYFKKNAEDVKCHCFVGSKKQWIKDTSVNYLFIEDDYDHQHFWFTARINIDENNLVDVEAEFRISIRSDYYTEKYSTCYLTEIRDDFFAYLDKKLKKKQ